jgi:pimeloyl-ACP methyl ester carboxylesterase
MHVLFIHGLGRSPLSGLKLLRALSQQGNHTSSFAYIATLETADGICRRLQQAIRKIANQDEYVLIGHSLGGVLARAAIADLPESIPLPRRIFMLGSPIQPSRLAQKLKDNPAFKFAAGDCGQLLASWQRMQEIGAPAVPITTIIGTRGFKGRFSPFADEDNDGIVSISESHAPWVEEELSVAAMHTWLPFKAEVAELIAQRLRTSGAENA